MHAASAAAAASAADAAADSSASCYLRGPLKLLQKKLLLSECT
jgi:hypothetical protein